MQRKKEGEEVDVELEEERRVEATPSTSAPLSEVLSEVQWEGRKKEEKVEGRAEKLGEAEEAKEACLSSSTYSMALLVAQEKQKMCKRIEEGEEVDGELEEERRVEATPSTSYPLSEVPSEVQREG